jgi:hypothetical protein
MIRKIFYSGLIVQILVLLVIVAAVIMVYKPGGRVTTATSSFALANSPASSKITEKHIYSNESNTALVPFLSPTEGHGGPILVVSSSSNPFSRYTVEMLRAEGLNYFAATDISELLSTTLENYDILILGEMTVTHKQVSMLTKWVNAGGTLIAFKPCSVLAPLMGITEASGELSDKYLLVNTTTAPGNGIVNETMQFHGTANLHLLKEASSIANLYSSATTATPYPAVTLRIKGVNGGIAVAFTYDLPKSIVYTRQGNPQWAGQKRDDQINPIRSDDLFYPDWVDLDKVAIPQADEQQRLLANIILQSNLDRMPLPRFWYLPRDLKAAIVMTGDDHAMNETKGRFNQYLALGPNTAQDIADWKAVRATSYIYPTTRMTDAEATAFEAQGFEIALHPTTNCSNYTATSIENTFTTQLARLSARFPGISAPVTNRNHCLVWSDWVSTPKAEVKNGIRLDASYYYWPASWIQNRPGMFTGSGIPMRFADMDGSIIDNYQLVTQMTDESGINISGFCNHLLDKALGPEGYYGVFCANMHTDTADHKGSNAIIASAQERQVPVIAARQLLTWLDGRNNSFFTKLRWHKKQLSFKIIARDNAKNLRAMLPLFSETGQLISITMNGNPVQFIVQTIKGMQYAFFSAAIGNNDYTADYNGSFLKVADQATITAENNFENEQNSNPLNLLQKDWK